MSDDPQRDRFLPRATEEALRQAGGLPPLPSAEDDDADGSMLRAAIASEIRAREELLAKTRAVVEEVRRDEAEGAAVRRKPVDRDGVLRFFAYDHLPKHLQAASEPFAECAAQVAFLDDVVDEGQRARALQKLLEAKDCAVRALLGG